MSANIESMMQTDMEATAFDTDADGSPSQEITYTTGGSDYTVYAIAGPEVTDRNYGADGQTDVKRREVIVFFNDDVTAAEIDDTMTIGSDVYKVDGIMQQNSVMARISAVLEEAVSRHHKSHVRKVSG